MTMVLSLIVILTQILIIASSNSVSSENQEFAFGKCEPNREKCRDCYFALVKSLLGSADNVFDLIKAFSPPGKNEPEYVIVTYSFNFHNNYTLNKDKIWFWSKSIAYYMFPMDILQKLSLFLSKNNQQEVRVTLNATECWGVSNEDMTLLTQKLPIYARAQSITPHLDNSNSAFAVSNETIDSVLAGVADIILVCPIVAIVLVFIIVVMLLVVYTKRDQWKKKPPLTKGSKATLLSLAVINASYTSVVVSIDIITISSRQQLYPIHGQVGKPYNNILYNIPVAVLVFDLLASIPSCLTASTLYTYKVNENINTLTDKEYYTLSLSTLGVFISLLNHSPYMAMAYFIDPYYTTGVLIFYAFVVISWFSLLEFIFDSWLRKPQSDNNNIQFRNRKCNLKRSCCYSTLFFALFVLYIGLVYTVLLYLLEIPIKPVFIAIGSFAMYKLVSRRKRLWNHQSTAQGTRQPEEYETPQDHPQDAEQQPLLTPQ